MAMASGRLRSTVPFLRKAAVNGSTGIQRSILCAFRTNPEISRNFATESAKKEKKVKKIEEKKYYNAMQVHLATENWTVIVQVVVKRKTEHAKKNSLPFKKYILTDMQGTKIPAATFNHNVDPLDKLLVPFKRYEISNADMKLVESMYRIGPYGYEWILTTNQLIQELPDHIPYPIPCTFNLARFCELSPYAERNEFINVRALVIGTIPAHGFGDLVRDYILINEEKIPIVLRCWTKFLENDDVNVSTKFPDPTLIIGMTLKVSTYHGISLATAIYNTHFLIDPPLSDAASLYQWYKENKREITELVNNRAYDDVNKLLPPPKEWYFRQIKQVTTTSDQFKAAWVTASLQLMPSHGHLWQPVCSICKKFFKGKVNWTFKCGNCYKDSKIIARARLKVFLTDSSGTMAATVYTPHVEKIIGMTATQLHEADLKGESLIEKVEKIVDGKKVFCFVWAPYKNEQNSMVVQLYTEDDLMPLENTQLQAADTQLMVQTPKQAPKERSQFFSPTLGAALEETTATSSSNTPAGASSPVSKRALKFGFNEPPVPESSPARDAVPPSPQMQNLQGPVKKSKSKGQQQGGQAN